MKRLHLSGKTKLTILLVLLALVFLAGISAFATKKTVSFFNANTVEFRSPLVLRSFVVVSKRKAPPVKVETVYVKEPTCEWSRECVEAYIEFVGEDDTSFIEWAKYTASWEGGYHSQLSQQNWQDSHGSEKGSFGQFQFGKPTYDQYCEDSTNWQMDWKAQTRCAKKIWDKGIAHNTWFNTTNKYLSEMGLRRLSYEN